MQPHPDLSPIPDLDADLLPGIDRFVADRSQTSAGAISRNDAINRILRDWLQQEGYIEPDNESRDFDDPSH